MEIPGIVDDALEGEEVAADVDLGGDDHLFVTPTRTLIYRSEGLLSDESVESYSHEAERLSVSEGRRKTKLTLTYPIEGTEEFALPAASAEAAIPAILAGVLNANGVLEPGESVLETFRFSELTLVITSERLVKHIGSAVWDVEFEEFRYEDVGGLSEEAGSVATQLVLEVGGRTERIKTPNDRAPEVVQRLEDALRSYHDLGPHEDVSAALSDDEDGDGDDEGDAADDGDGGGMTFEDGVAPLDAGDTTNRTVDGLEDDAGASAGGGTASGDGGTEAASGVAEPTASGTGATDAGAAAGGGTDAASDVDDASAGSTSEDESSRAAASSSDAGSATDSGADAAEEAATADEPDADADDDSDPFEEAGFESASGSPDLEAEIQELREAVEQQNELLARQQETIEQLVEELRRGR